MKKWLSMAAVAVLALCGFAACSSGGDEPDPVDPVVEVLENYLSGGKLIVTITERTGGGYDILFTDDTTLFVPISDTGVTAVTEDSNNVYFFVKDGRKITLPKAPEDSIVQTLTTLAQSGAEIAKVVDLGGAYEITFADGTKITVTITNTGIVSVSEDAQNVYFTRRNGSQIIIPKQQVAIIAFADPKVKAICLQYWDTDKDGELSEAEAAAVNGADYVYNHTPFFNRDDITSFDEFRYFTGFAILPYGSFRWCYSITNITLPETITSIGEYAFDDCKKLEHLIIPAGVTQIGEYAFSGCKTLTEITIPAKVTSLGEYVFAACDKLKTIHCQPTTPPSLGANVFSNIASDYKIYVPAASVDAYKSAWSQYADHIVAE